MSPWFRQKRERAYIGVYGEGMPGGGDFER